MTPDSKRSLRIAALGLALTAIVSRAGVAQFEPFGMRQSNYWRVGLGTSQPVSASGVYEDYSRGFSVMVETESWTPDANGNEQNGSGFAIGYARFPLNQSFFNQTFADSLGAHPTSSSGTGGFYTFAFQILRRIPFPALSPSATFGLGLFDLARATVHYQTANTSGTTQLPERYGIMGSGGLTIDRSVTPAFGFFAQGIYTIALDISTVGYSVRSATCAGASCGSNPEHRLEPLGDLRAGVRFRTK